MSQEPPYTPTEGTPPAPGSPLPPYAASQQPVYPQSPQQQVYPQPGYAQPVYPQPGYAYTTPQGYPVGPPVERRVTGLGWTAFGLSIFGFILACIPLVSIWSGIILLAAFVISIVVLARRGDTKWPGIVAMIVSVIGGIVAAAIGLMTIIGLMLAVPTTFHDLELESVGPSSPVNQDATWTVDGTRATTSNGIVVTVQAVTCGLGTVTGLTMDSTPEGDFCEVHLTIANYGSVSPNVYVSNFGALIDDTPYEYDSLASSVGGEPMSTLLLPGEESDALIYFDVPAGESLTAVTVEGISPLPTEKAVIPVG